MLKHTNIPQPNEWDGDRLRRLRLSQGLTMRELAQRAKIGHDLISRFESGWRSPNIETVYRLQRGLQCSWRELLGPDN